MRTLIDKRHRAALLRDRLGQAIAEKGMSQSALARRIGVDRSTVSQLLSADGTRLPNAQVVAECAAALGVSADWLLGLTERPERVAELLAASVSLTEAPRALVDEQILTWHEEASGYKIRHVPATLPDMLKTHEMLRWEYAPHVGRTIDQAIRATEDRLALLYRSQSDFEIALPMDELEIFARGEGYYRDLPKEIRRGQINHLIALHEELYPQVRIHQFDARRVFSAPLTVFGPFLAVLYIGRNYLAFRDTERVEAMRLHFDTLVREAVIGSRDLPDLLTRLKKHVG